MFVADIILLHGAALRSHTLSLVEIMSCLSWSSYPLPTIQQAVAAGHPRRRVA